MQWMKRAGALLALSVLVVAAVLAGCGQQATQPAGYVNDELVSLGDSSKHDALLPMAASYPNFSFALNVPWMSQVPPKRSTDTDARAWQLTNNCGQAICTMLGGYYNHGTVAPWVINAENSMLGCSRPYGCATGYTQLERLLREFHGLHSAYYTGNLPDDVVMEGAHGRPVIVGVRTHMQESGGRPHWMLFVGYSGGYMYFHDPGRARAQDGRFVRYTIDQFYRSWKNQGKHYIPVWK